MAKCRGCVDGFIWESGHLKVCPLCHGTGEAPHSIPPPSNKPPKKKK